MDKKTCTKCNEEKLLEDFHKQSKGKFGRNAVCKVCRKIAKAKYYKENRDSCLERSNKWKLNNKERTSQYRKEWNRKNKDRVNDRRRSYCKERYANDINFRLLTLLRNRLSKFVSGKYKSKGTMKLLGCSLEVLRSHLESQFTDGMTWDNQGMKGWHIDHIIPCSSFDLTQPDQQRQCFHYTNLQPLWEKDNLKKGSTL